MKITVLVLTLLLAGCSSKSTLPTVRIGIVGNGLQTWCLPITLAQSLGYYKEEGLAVELENLPSTGKSMQALVGGSVDVSTVTYQQVVQIGAEGQRLRAFFITTARPSNVLLVAPAAQQRISRVEDLKGALVGISAPGSNGHAWVNAVLLSHGIRPSEFTVVTIGVGAARVAAIESGRIDVASLGGGDHLIVLKRHPNLRILLDSSTPEGLRASYGGDVYAGGTITAKQEWLDRNPDVARRLARALLRSLQWSANHTPEEIRQQLPDAAKSQDAALDLEIIRWGVKDYSKDGAMPMGAPGAMKRFNEANAEKLAQSNLNLAATWTNEYLPLSK